MSVKNKSADMLGLDFECHDDLPDELCGAYQEDYYFNDGSGEYVCSRCLGTLHREMHDAREDLYDEEDDQDSGAMNEDANFVAEGDRSMLDFTPDFTKRVQRENMIIELIDSIQDDKLTLFMAMNQQEIIDLLREHEQSDHPMFRDTGPQRLPPKIVAVASFLRNIPPNRAALTKAGINATTTLRMYQYLQRVGRPDKEPRIEMTFLSVGKSLGMGESLIRSALEEYESSRPMSSITSPYDAIVAWLYVMAKKYNFKLTQKEAIEKTNAGRNSTRKAIKEFKEFLSNLKVSKETPTAHGLKEGDDLEQV